MTSRQSLARHQGKAVLKRSPRLPLGTSSAHRAYVAKIDWADAPIIEVEATTLAMIEVDIKSDSITELRRFSHQVAAGEVLYLVATDHPGYYFLVRFDGEGWRCTCPTGCTGGHCGHQVLVADFVALESDLHEQEAAAASSDSVEAHWNLMALDMSHLVVHLAGREITVPLVGTWVA
jgi:hypothetical protein